MLETKNPAAGATANGADASGRLGVDYSTAVPAGVTPYARHVPEEWELPQQLTELPIWFAWRLVPGDKKPGKVPVSAVDGSQNWRNPNKATTAARAIQYANDNPHLHGVGIVVSPEHGLIGGDPDQCRRETGEPNDVARSIIEEADTYTEVSPGLEGFRFIAKGTFGGYTGNNQSAHVEFYEDARFLTMTGFHVEGTPFAIEERDLTELAKRFHRARKDDRPAGDMPEPEIADAAEFNIPPHVFGWITEGVPAGEDRSTHLFGAAKDLIRAGATDGQALYILTDPENPISEAAYERRGSERSARQWVWKYNVATARREVDAEPTLEAPGFDAKKPEPHINPDDLLPGHPEALLNLPHGLGKIQDWIHGRMKYPSRATAGVGALATLTAFTQSHITVDSFGGLGLNEQYLVLAPTGFGKEDLRAPISVLAEASALDMLFDGNRSEIQWSPPSSLQGMHKLLEENPAQMFLSDEFAEWLAQTSSDAHKQAALGYFMQLYTKALSTVNAPHAVTNTYSPVKNPRVSVLATSTAERILESMTLSHADSGAYNRWLILLAEQDRIPKRYTGLQYEPPEDVVELVRKVGCYSETTVTFSSEAWAHFVEHDSHVIEPLKFDDNHLAGRLSEQAIKIAALVALSDSRTEINVQDLRTAYAIREGLYHRVRAMVSHEGGFTGMHATGQALEQLRDVLTRKEFVYKSRLPALSRKYKGLSLPERQAVLAALYDAGEIEDVKDRKGLIQCNVSAGG